MVPPRPSTLYLSGPMTGYPDFNRAAFYLAEHRLRASGYLVLSPARLRFTEPYNPSWSDWMRPALELMLRADGIAMLDDWRKSTGARLEVALAVDLAIPVYSVDWWRSERPRYYPPRRWATLIDLELAERESNNKKEG